MPGNQGGSNWGTTAADPAEGHGVRRRRQSGRDPEARGRHEAQRRSGHAVAAAPATQPLQAGFAAYQQHCTVVPRRRPAGCAAGRRESSSASPIAWERTPSRRSSPAARANASGLEHHRRRADGGDRVPRELRVATAGTRRRGGRGRGAGPAGTFPPGPVVGQRRRAAAAAAAASASDRSTRALAAMPATQLYPDDVTGSCRRIAT